MARGGLIGRPKLKPETPASISLLRTKNGLDNGVHFSHVAATDEIVATRNHITKCRDGQPIRFFTLLSYPAA
jgi:hypothetical protein